MGKKFKNTEKIFVMDNTKYETSIHHQ